jgi:hypothetical protein
VKPADKRGPTGNIIIFAIIKMGETNVLVNNTTIPEFIITNFLDSIDIFGDSLTPGTPDRIAFDNGRSTFKSIVNLFITDISRMPAYTTWIAQSKNISATRALKINNISGNGIVYNDAISSIWNYLFLQFVNNFNNLFNTELLGYVNYMNNVGAEMLQYLTTISNNYLNYNITSTSSFDYIDNSRHMYLKYQQVQLLIK